MLIMLSFPLVKADSVSGDIPPDTSSELPPLPTLPEENGLLSTLDRVYVEAFRFDGNHIFSDTELADLTKDYIKRQISAEELQEAKNLITKHYVDAGYINSGAIIPDQSVNDNLILIKIIEGQLVQIDISGHKHLRTRYIEKRLETDDALNINMLQTKLQILQQNRLFKRINAELGPGINLGEAILRMQVTEATPYQLTFAFNNHRSPSIGAYRGELIGEYYNLTGWGDSLYARYGVTEGLDDYRFEYTFPLTRHDTTLSISAERGESQVVEAPFDRINITSNSDTYAVSLRHPFRWGIEKELGIGVRLENRKSETFIDDDPFAFSTCTQTVEQRGKSDITMLRFFQDWLDRDRNHVIAARSSFNFEMDGWGDSINLCERTVTWLGQFQWVQRTDFEWFEDYDRLRNSQLLLRADLQWAKDDLIPLEKISIGGALTVRGYRENLLTRDRGFISSLEWRIPITRLPITKISGTDDGWLQIAPFIDYGRAWNVDSDTPDPKDIYSVGLGLRWAPSQKIQAELYWGAALRDVDDPEDEDLQDKGIHFGITMAF